MIETALVVSCVQEWTLYLFRYVCLTISIVCEMYFALFQVQYTFHVKFLNNNSTTKIVYGHFIILITLNIYANFKLLESTTYDLCYNEFTVRINLGLFRCFSLARCYGVHKLRIKLEICYSHFVGCGHYCLPAYDAI
jgi:hypothetical protein